MDKNAFTRFAVYFTPAPGPLAEFGARWLGWDVATGTTRAHPEIAGLPLPLDQITQTPRKYGFHATVKPPMRLTEGTRYAAFEAEVAALASQIGPVSLAGLQVSRLGSFVALTPVGDVTALAAMASRFVRELDAFRAPPTEAELARRRQSGLSPAQDALLLKWGYPYVLEEFRYHMTLSGRLPETDAEMLRAALDPVVAEIVPGAFTLDGISIAGEGEGGRFHLIRRIPFTGPLTGV